MLFLSKFLDRRSRASYPESMKWFTCPCCGGFRFSRKKLCGPCREYFKIRAGVAREREFDRDRPL